MRRFTALLAAIGIIGVATSAIAIYGTGYGNTVTASTTSARLGGFTANAVSILNLGTNDAFVLASCTTNTFNTRLAAGTTIKVPGGQVWTFDSEQQTSIDSICYATTNGTTDLLIGAY